MKINNLEFVLLVSFRKNMNDYFVKKADVKTYVKFWFAKYLFIFDLQCVTNLNICFLKSNTSVEMFSIRLYFKIIITKLYVLTVILTSE